MSTSDRELSVAVQNYGSVPLDEGGDSRSGGRVASYSRSGIGDDSTCQRDPLLNIDTVSMSP
jgi:hypothetical protein